MQSSKFRITWACLLGSACVSIVFSIFILPSRSHAAETCPVGSKLENRGDATIARYVCEAPLNQNDSCRTGFIPADRYDLSRNKYQVCEAPVTESPAEPTKCDSTYQNVVYPVCWFKQGVTYFSALIISVAGWVLSVAGYLFDLAIWLTISAGKSWLSPPILQAVGTAWTFFRDIANIIIIGLFVFIAIGIILGLEEYGQKKLIARVLIVAILINFSFLFTQIVINFSNAMANQFSKTIVSSNAENIRIDTKFGEILGINEKEFLGSKDVLAAIVKDSEKGAWVAVSHALLITSAAWGFAILLIYGALLLIMRALIFIFLLLTSSLAFATFLVPSFANSAYGWRTWWQALLRNALLAPVMMIFLAAIIRISEGFVQGYSPQGKNAGFLGSLATSPSQNIDSLFKYIFILGLLYGAIRISNSFAGFAGQLAWAGTSPIVGALKKAGMGSALAPIRGLGLLARNTIGRKGLEYSGQLRESQLKNGRPGGLRGLYQDFGIRSGSFLGKQSFDPFNTKSGQAALKSIGAQFGEYGKGGYAGVKKRQADEAIKAAKEAGYESASDVEKKANKVMEKSQQIARDQLAQQKQAAEEAKKTAENVRAQAEQQHRDDAARRGMDRTRVETEKNSAAAEQVRLEQLKTRTENEYKEQLSIENMRIAQARRGSPEELQARAAYDTIKANRDRAMTPIDTGIASQKNIIAQKTADLAALDRSTQAAGDAAVQAEKNARDAEIRQINQTVENLNKVRQSFAKQAVDSVSLEAAAKRSAVIRAGTLGGLTTLIHMASGGSIDDDPVAQRIGGRLKAMKHAEDLTHLGEALKKHESDHGKSTEGHA